MNDSSSLRVLGRYGDRDILVADVPLVEIGNVRRVPNAATISVFVSDARTFTPAELEGVAAVVARWEPLSVWAFGRGSEQLHDAVDIALYRSARFAKTFWSEAYEIGDAVFDTLFINLPTDEDWERWTERLVVLDDMIPLSVRTELRAAFASPDRFL